MKFKESPLFRRRGAVTDRKPEPERQAEIRRHGNIPAHIAIIMDGNGRWAQSRGLPRIAGHNEGVESVRDTVEACGQVGVKYLTLYAFSIENWKRPDEEVTLLMRLLMKALRDETDKLHRNNVRVSTIGETASLPRAGTFRAAALDAINQVQWIPDWGRSRIESAVKTRPDWCISRQRAWGVPIPAFYDAQGDPLLDARIVRAAADLV